MKINHLIACLGVVLCFASGAFGDTIYGVSPGTTVTYSQQSDGGLPSGTYAVDGSMDIFFIHDTGTDASFGVNLYSISLDANSNGMFYESGDVIVESAPFTNIVMHIPDFGSVLDTRPIAILTTNIGGTWELTGRIGEYDANPAMYGGDTDSNAGIAAGTFIGSYTNPSSFTLTRGYPDDVTPGQLGPSLNSGLGSPSLTFVTVPEPSSIAPTGLGCLLMLGLGFRRRLRANSNGSSIRQGGTVDRD